MTELRKLLKILKGFIQKKLYFNKLKAYAD